MHRWNFDVLLRIYNTRNMDRQEINMLPEIKMLPDVMLPARKRNNSDRIRKNEIHIGFSPHYIEAIPGIVDLMRSCQVIALEEPRTLGFQGMLDQRLEIDEYLLNVDLDFPVFARRFCQELQELHAHGRHILQLDPFLDRLVAIHELLADQKTPADILAIDHLRDVYLAEKDATGALIAFYDQSTKDDFPALIETVKIFARLDARRIRLRDQLRADALAELASTGNRIFAEAGYMHYGLFRCLLRRAPNLIRIQPYFVLERVVRYLRARHRNMGPGDILTLLYVLHDVVPRQKADLLAARSLIAIKLVAKEELIPSQEIPYPQSVDDARVNAIVQGLGYSECKKLFERIQNVPRSVASRYASQMLGGQPF